ncbi:TetR/AcrR family transcriptional regulator [Geodermatophilus sp. SYSU D00815]
MPRPRTVDDEAILAATAAAVGEVGPSRLTLADVGTRVGLAPATLLQRFGSRRGLLLALAAHDVDAAPRRIRAAATGDRKLAGLVEVLSDEAAALRTPAEFANHLSLLLLDLSDPEFQALARRHAQGVLAAVVDVLTAARDAGELPDDTDPDALGSLVHATYNGALVSWGLDPDGRPAEAVARRLDALLGLVRRS